MLQAISPAPDHWAPAKWHTAFMVLPRIAALLDAKRALFLDRMVSVVQGTVPRYELLPATDFRASLDGLLEALVSLLRGVNPTLVQERLMVAADRRIAQGFSAADYLRAVFIVPNIMTLSGMLNASPLANVID